MNKKAVDINTIFRNLFAFWFLGNAAVVLAAANSIAIFEVRNEQGDVGQTPFIQVTLTHNIYAFSQQANLQNLVVLDADQNSLPYRLVASVEPERAEPKILESNLAFFPVAADATPDNLRKVYVTQARAQGDSMQVNSVQIVTSNALINNKLPEFYLIDISKLAHDISHLRIDWNAQNDNQYLEVELEGTRNLQDWIPLGRATLVDINQQGHTLKRNTINAKIAQNEYEFLRVKVVRGGNNLRITQMVAEQKNTVPDVMAMQKESWRLIGESSKTQTSVYLPSSHSKTSPVTAWEFTRAETTPIEQISIDLGAHYYGDRATLLSRNNPTENWQLQHKGVWFNVQLGSQWQASDAIRLAFVSAKYWRLELNRKASSIQHPALVFSWHPLALQFIANNKPPFRLAIQTNQADNNNRDQVFNQIIAASTPKWTHANLHTLDVAPNALASVSAQRDWKQWIFWLALMLAVLVLLLFAFRLFKQLNVHQQKP